MSEKISLPDFITSFNEAHGNLVESLEIFEDTRASIKAKKRNIIKAAKVLMNMVLLSPLAVEQ